MSAKEFRAELEKIMPGYKWTIHKSTSRTFATGVQSSGFNRLSTLQVEKAFVGGFLQYSVKSSGSGTRAPWLYEASGGTLAQALRALQKHYEYEAANFKSHAQAIERGRKKAAEIASDGAA